MGIRNLASFNAALTKFGADIDRKAILFQKKVAFLVLGAYVSLPTGAIRGHSGLMQFTPIDTGRAIGNYQVSVGSPAGGEIGGFSKTVGEAGRGAAQARATRAAVGAISRVGFGQSIWIVNNLPYIVVLNDGGVNRTAHHMLERAISNTRAALRAGSR